jgi:hypothetical protein
VEHLSSPQGQGERERKKRKINKKLTGHWWLTPEILATLDTEIMRIKV